MALSQKTPRPTPRIKTYKIGITGGLCTGKTSVRKVLARLGVSTMDSEEVINSVITAKTDLTRRLVRHFGKSVLDSLGRLSPKKLEQVILSNPVEKKYLEESINPMVREEVKKFLYGPLGTNIRAVESPNLFETDSAHLYDEIWTVFTTGTIQKERLIKRDQLDKDTAELRIISEFDIENKKAQSQRLIDNSGDWLHTEQLVKKALDEVKGRVTIGM